MPIIHYGYLLSFAAFLTIYTGCLYLFYLVNMVTNPDTFKDDPLVSMIKYATMLTLFLYGLAGLAYLAGCIYN